MMHDVICLMGPTGSGKTDLAIDLLAHLPGEIISVDSAMLYEDFNIGAAKPTAEVLSKAPHYLVDFTSPLTPYSAAQFCQDATVLCDEIIERGHVPLLVGGSMMYFRALQQGLAPLPKACASLRESLKLRLDTEGLPSLYRELEQVDAVSASRLHPHDTQRILRALEVYHAKGEPLSTLQKQNPTEGASYRWINLALFPEDRAWLHARIEKRFTHMLEAGFLNEVETILKKYGDEVIDTPAMKSVGYRQAVAYLKGEYDFETFKHKAVVATRNLAKRQLTWLRSWPDIHCVDPAKPECMQAVLELLSRMLDNGFSSS